MSKNKKFALSITFIILGMIFLTYASAPLYNIFCKVTGTGGIVRPGLKMSDRIGTKKITVKFDANIEDQLGWTFENKQREITVTTGENAIIFYEAHNNSDKDVIGTAIYNVTPYKAAKYFFKIQCFCFQEQLLKAGQKMNMPVSFYIDPAIEDDPNLKDINTITLSYKFYKVTEK